MRLCTFPNCGRKHRAHGLCKPHYSQLLRGCRLSPLRPPRSAATHGTRARYVGGCHCEDCRHAERIYKRTIRLRAAWGPIFESFLRREAA